MMGIFSLCILWDSPNQSKCVYSCNLMRVRQWPLLLVYSEVFMYCGPPTLKFDVREEYRQDPIKGLFCYTWLVCCMFYWISLQTWLLCFTTVVILFSSLYTQHFTQDTSKFACIQVQYVHITRNETASKLLFADTALLLLSHIFTWIVSWCHPLFFFKVLACYLVL